eukprot:c18199_g1_i1.p1 GENE.c18199_g1_i1~~c18199_g1_i1.p1  ORF type:complete len:177 (+),score=37.00 c18199_g1_i1:3-533(+)
MGGGGRRSGSASPDCFPPGTEVKLTGLRREHLNDKLAQVVSYNHDPSNMRYTVQLDDDEQQVAVRPENIEQVGVQATVTGVQDANVNGAAGVVLGFDHDSGRYRVQVGGGRRIIAVKPENILLDQGTLVRVTGLTKAPQHNNKVGQIVAYHEDKGRYDLQFSDNQTISVKLENVRL